MRGRFSGKFFQPVFFRTQFFGCYLIDVFFVDVYRIDPAVSVYLPRPLPIRDGSCCFLVSIYLVSGSVRLEPARDMDIALAEEGRTLEEDFPLPSNK